jgi:hypothetical protein
VVKTNADSARMAPVAARRDVRAVITGGVMLDAARP